MRNIGVHAAEIFYAELIFSFFAYFYFGINGVCIQSPSLSAYVSVAYHI